ncbi:MAG: TonB family protein [Bacteroidales bacterium]|nr:TonB family protein [Bacteroidales bacterium]
MKGENKAGFLITVIFHLTVIIVMLLFTLGAEIHREQSFVIDFTKEEELQKRLQEELFKEDISKKVEALMNAAKTSSPAELKNLVVNRGALKDDRGTDARKLYEEADKLAQKLKDGQKSAIEDTDKEDYANPDKDDNRNTAEQHEYTNASASVLSYSLDGRKATRMPAPSYLCYRGGDVTVIIVVDQNGTVIDAKVQDEVSSPDRCLREKALAAAKASRFNRSPSSPARQTGDICYRFIAQ